MSPNNVEKISYSAFEYFILVFIIYYKYCHMSAFGRLATFIQILRSKHEKISIGYSCFNSCKCDYTPPQLQNNFI